MASRIRELSVTEEIFDWPTDFDLTAYHSGFVMFRGSQPYQVEIEFDEYQARWLRERSAFHRTEQREELRDGRLRLRLTVTALDGVKRFVMQYGAHAQVLAPEVLRTEIREELTRSLKLYQGSKERGLAEGGTESSL